MRTVAGPLVGREAQLVLLRDLIGRSIAFHTPQLVTVIGHQGTGKTRLLEELSADLGAESARGIRVLRGSAERNAHGAPIRGAALASMLRHRFALAGTPGGKT